MSIPLNEFDYQQRRLLNRSDPGEVTDAVELREGLLLYRLIEEEETPDFPTLARELSDADSAEDGGAIGLVGLGSVQQ